MTDDEYWNQGIEALDANNAMVEEIIASFPDSHRIPIQLMLSGPIGEQFLSAPASSRKQFHYAFPGGLVAHSLNVVRNAVNIANALAPKRWPQWKVMFCALFHDVGKAGLPGKPNYIQCTDKWKRERGEFYSTEQDEWMPTSEKGCRLLQSFGVPLDHEEYMAIRLNDGMGPAENKPYSFKEPALALIIHWADHWASIKEKEEIAP